MQDLPLPDASADLVWAVGSAYIMGFDAALTLARLRRQQPDAGSVLDEVEREIDVRREHGADYGYTTYVLRAR